MLYLLSPSLQLYSDVTEFLPLTNDPSHRLQRNHLNQTTDSCPVIKLLTEIKLISDS